MKKAQRPAGFEPMTSQSRDECFTAAIQQWIMFVLNWQNNNLPGLVFGRGLHVHDVSQDPFFDDLLRAEEPPQVGHVAQRQVVGRSEVDLQRKKQQRLNG